MRLLQRIRRWRERCDIMRAASFLSTSDQARVLRALHAAEEDDA